MKNNNALNLTVLTGMHPCEFEEWRERGENDRHILTSAVAQLLHVPAGWNVNGEYRGEFGGFFPVQLRYTPPGEAFSLCVCSPGDVSGEWLIVLVSADGNCVREVLRLLPMLADARRFGIPATLRGLLNNDFRQTAETMFELSKKDKQAGVQIDPTLYEKYNIRAVPALVVTCGSQSDVLYGSLPVKQALEEIKQRGDCGSTAAQLLQDAEGAK